MLLHDCMVICGYDILDGWFLVNGESVGFVFCLTFFDPVGSVAAGGQVRR